MSDEIGPPADLKQKIEAANAEALKRINAAEPVLIDVAPAGEGIPGLKDISVSPVTGFINTDGINLKVFRYPFNFWTVKMR